jgi:hypothetical protein
VHALAQVHIKHCTVACVSIKSQVRIQLPIAVAVSLLCVLLFVLLQLLPRSRGALLLLSVTQLRHKRRWQHCGSSWQSCKQLTARAASDAGLQGDWLLQSLIEYCRR